MNETATNKAFFKEGIQNDKAFLKDDAFLKDGMDDAALAGVAGGTIIRRPNHPMQKSRKPTIPIA